MSSAHDRGADLTRREMFAEIKQLCKTNNVTNWFVLIREWTVFAVVVTGCVWSYHTITNAGYSPWAALPVYVASVVVIAGWTQTRLSCLVHESSHYSLFKNRKLNDLAANLLVAFPFFGLISNYRIGHWGHHRHVNDPDKDPDLHRLLKHHPRNFPIPKWRVWVEYVLLQLSPHKAFTYLKGRALYVAKTMNHKRVKGQTALSARTTKWVRIGFYVGLFTLLTVMGWWTYYLLFWLVPIATVYPATLFLREIAHHGNYPDNGDFTNSRVYEGYWLEREIFFPFGEWNHVLHHMFPTIPWYRMREAHETMMRYPPYRENVIICDGFFFKAHKDNQQPTVLDLLAAPSGQQLKSHEEQDWVSSIRAETATQVGAEDQRGSLHAMGES
ncbi:MAG: fatty acid desaturase [Planctomycetota bacterium]